MDLSYPNTIQKMHSIRNSVLEIENSCHDNFIRQNTQLSFMSPVEFSQTSRNYHKPSTSFVIGGKVNESQEDKHIHSDGNVEMETENPHHDNFIRQTTHSSFTPPDDFSQTSRSINRPSTSLIIGEILNESQEGTADVTRMEIDDILPKPPLIVVDGANIAYAYAKAVGLNGEYSSLARNLSGGGVEPDVQGIHICASYFANAGCRIQVVLPVHWMKKKPRANDRYQNGNAQMITSQIDILQNLEDNNILCCSPPADDDDAYVIAMARREDGRARRKNIHYTSSSCSDTISAAGGAFVLSNDFFRDAMARDSTGELKYWLNGSGTSQLPFCPPGRISFSFCNLGSMNEYGDPQLDFMPNPRHKLIETIEKVNRTMNNSSHDC